MVGEQAVQAIYHYTGMIVWWILTLATLLFLASQLWRLIKLLFRYTWLADVISFYKLKKLCKTPNDNLNGYHMWDVECAINKKTIRKSFFDKKLLTEIYPKILEINPGVKVEYEEAKAKYNRTAIKHLDGNNGEWQVNFEQDKE